MVGWCVGLARTVIGILAETGNPDTYAAVFNRGAEDLLPIFPPVRHERFRDGVLDPYPVQILPVGLAERLPPSPEWTHEELANGRVLVQPADLTAWFEPVQPPPHLHEQATAHYRAILPWLDCGMAATKWSVSVEENLAARVESHVGDRGLSSFVARAVEHELERDLLDEYLVELDDEFGPLPERLVEEIDERWPS